MGIDNDYARPDAVEPTAPASFPSLEPATPDRPDVDTADTTEDEPAKPRQTPTQVVMKLVDGNEHFEPRYDFIRGTDGELYATPRRDVVEDVAGFQLFVSEPATFEARPFADLTGDLRAEMWERIEFTPSTDALKAAMMTIAALKMRDDSIPRVDIPLRAVNRRDGLFVDIGSAGVLRLSTADYDDNPGEPWRLMKPGDPQVPRFRRASQSAPLPVPLPGGSREEMQEILGLSDETSRLMWGAAVSAYLHDMDRPHLWAVGPQGSGKTTALALFAELLDGQPVLGAPLESNPRDNDSRFISNYVVTTDNISSMTQAMSDVLCRLTTGYVAERRALWTNNSTWKSTIRRQVFASSITLPHNLGADARQRMIVVDFPRLSEYSRRTGSEIREQFAARREYIYGALLRDVATARVNFHRAREAMSNESVVKPRLADFGALLLALDMGTEDGPPQWATGAEGPQSLGWFGADSEIPDGGFYAAYVEHEHTGQRERVDDDPWITAVLDVARKHTSGETWRTTTRELLSALQAGDRYGTGSDVKWPSSPAALGKAVAAAAEPMYHAGILIVAKRDMNGRWFELSAV